MKKSHAGQAFTSGREREKVKNKVNGGGLLVGEKRLVSGVLTIFFPQLLQRTIWLTHGYHPLATTINIALLLLYSIVFFSYLHQGYTCHQR